ncbi:hypothetical protein Nepgr_015767 [Nepenthes gracilis]|uniref:FHA domain-containing protein n=1 Tax=Nepenthes gracilis TaxID=150966 RepID=A0AAD3SP33_NEPGR|nr:hypothetical protein Nepgr_015767 [Nepenthes gracilis]
MGALAPIAQWIPEDDLILKNAVEAGASLESLAKGAVHFSRRFTIRELQDRWYSLLYDPVISVEASVCMIEFERSAFNAPSKSTRTNNANEKKYGHGKRKAESVRRCYYAMQKRICSEPLNQAGDSFLVAAGDNCCLNGNDALEPNTIVGVPTGNHFGFEDADFGTVNHVFSEVVEDSGPSCGVGGSSHGFHIRQQNKLQDLSLEKASMQGVIPHNVGKDVGVNGNGLGVGVMEPSINIPAHNLFVAHDMETNNISSTIDNMCSGYAGNQVFNSSISDCEASIHHLQYSSPPPAMSDWRTIGAISTPKVPGDASMGEKDLQAGDAFGIPDEGYAGDSRTSEFEVAHSESKLKNQMSCSQLKNSTDCTEGYLAELSNSLLDFTSEEEMLFMDADGKKGIDKSYLENLSSLLLNSPNDVNEDQMSSLPETRASVAPEIYVDIPTGSCAGELDSDGNNCLGDKPITADSVEHMPSSASVSSQFPELLNGVICCTLNTEDPDIPCNDDVILTAKPRPSSFRKTTFNIANHTASSFKNSSGSLTSEAGLNIVKREAQAGSQTSGPEMGLSNTASGFGVKFEVPESDSINVASKHPDIAYGGVCESTLVPKRETSEVVLSRQSGCNLADKPTQVSVSVLQTSSARINQEAQELTKSRNQELHAQVVSKDAGVPDPAGERLLSDPEEQSSESDADIPYFSDIESMILDMDLGPDDQASYSSRGVLKYQHEEAKRAIIRLEQGAHSYMQRAMASHGAFAVFYGRHSKHYIKKPEVLLGRATDDVTVDIDLGREGRANKISRRQAIIKMDKDGSFHLRNLGKCSISVNCKEIYSGQSLSLHPNCLIEIRGMPFIFETNHTWVKQYCDDATRKDPSQGT